MMICKSLILLNLSVFPWTKAELVDINRIGEQCMKYHNGCVTKVIKKDLNLLNVICKEEKKLDK